MRFAGAVWRLLVGVKDALVLLFMLLFFGVLYAALTMRPNAGAVRDGALLLDIAGTVTEQPSSEEPLELIAGGGSLVREYRLRDIVHGLDKAASDKRIKAVALDLDVFGGGGQAAMSDIGAALDRVRSAGKPVIAYSSAYTDDSYQIAAHASEIWLNPLGAVLIAGPGGTNLYYKGLLDKLGVTANVYRVGAYKSAVEPFTRNDMSPEAREAAQALASSLWEAWQQDVGQARPKARIATYAAAPVAAATSVRGDMAKAALDFGLVDRLGDRRAFEKRVADIVGKDGGPAQTPFKHTRMDTWTAANPSSDSSGQIGVLTVAGSIVDGESKLGTAGAETIAQALQRGLDKGNLKALVIRIDSPGGSTFASERIRQAIIDAKQGGIPVVTSMGSVAASGGYWIATAGSPIFAEPSTITGSIGVFGVLPSFQGALAKLGIGADGVKTTPLSGEPNVFEGISPETGQLIQLGVEDAYRRFVELVAKARNMAPARVHQIAQGRVWDGGTARQLGLVDQFGTLDDAIAEAARRARLDPAKVKPVFLERQPTYFDQLLAAAGGAEAPPEARDAFSRAALRPQMLMMRAVLDAEQLMTGAAIQARCLECGPYQGTTGRNVPAATRITRWLGQ